MGYRSEVHIGVAFANRADLNEVMSVYTIDPRVQKYNLREQWELKEDNILYFYEGYTKWYESYEEVQGIEHLLDLVESFHSERDMPIAFRFLRVGEEPADIEEREEHGGDDGTLIEKLYDGITLVRDVEVSL